jgi:hypothetical protein
MRSPNLLNLEGDVRSKKTGWPRAVLDAIIQLIQDHLDTTSPTLPCQLQIRQAVKSQIKIGLHLLPHGFISRHWVSLLEDFQTKYPRAKVTSLLCSIWIDFTDAIWHAQNKLVHQQENPHRLASAKSYSSRLLWYLENSHVIPRSGNFLLNFTAQDIDHMSTRVKRHTLHHLDIARKPYVIQLQQRQWGQSVLTQFFPILTGNS